VRLPPGFAPSAPPQKPTKVHAAYYKSGRRNKKIGRDCFRLLMFCFMSENSLDILF
jgi:hypothetical protein